MVERLDTQEKVTDHIFVLMNSFLPQRSWEASVKSARERGATAEMVAVAEEEITDPTKFKERWKRLGPSHLRDQEP